MFACLKRCFVLTTFTESGTLHSHSVGSVFVLMFVGGETYLLAKLLSAEQFKKVLIAGELIKYGQFLCDYILQDI